MKLEVTSHVPTLGDTLFQNKRETLYKFVEETHQGGGGGTNEEITLYRNNPSK